MSRSESSEVGSPPSIEEFLGEPTRDLERWRWLWEGDTPFPIQSHRPGFWGRIVVFLKRLGRPIVKAPQADLLDRQRAFNLVVLEYLEQIEALGATIDSIRDDLVRDLTEVRTDLLRDVQNNHRRVSHLEAFKREGYGDVMKHSDALFAVVDQKLDRYRRESELLRARLSSLLSIAGVDRPTDQLPELEQRWTEQNYRDLEDRFRGTDEEIRQRVTVYLPRLIEHQPVLDMGCGRGEMLVVLKENQISARGIDSSSEMISLCREQGLDVTRADMLEELSEVPEGSLGAAISLHVIEHLPESLLPRLIRSAWRALKPGGLLILETPNPLSLVVSGSNFWRDPTHLRPIHPDTLSLLLEQAGFDPVERLELRPFEEADRLPEVAVADLPPEARQLGESVNKIRDAVDQVLFGAQDYAVIGVKPVAGREVT